MIKYVTEWASGCPETPCGKGARITETVEIRSLIAELVSRYNIQSVADVGCGDRNWITSVKWPHPVEYDGFDLVRTDPPFDCVQQILPKAYDMIMTIYVLNHIYVTGGLDRAIQNFKASGSKYLLSTYYAGLSMGIGEPIESVPHKITPNSRPRPLEWHYGLWEL